MTRNCMIEIINSDVVRTARAKGLGEFGITLHHMFRLVLIPLNYFNWYAIWFIIIRRSYYRNNF